MPDLFGVVTDPSVYAGRSAQAWFAGGEGVGYDLKARAIVAAQDAPLRIFLKREGNVAHAISFLRGFPDGSFGWAKVLPHLKMPGVRKMWSGPIADARHHFHQVRRESPDRTPRREASTGRFSRAASRPRQHTP